MKKFLLTTSITVLLSSGAVVSAQSLPQMPNFQENVELGNTADAGANQIAIPSPIPGGVTNIVKAKPTLPSANEEMSLDHFDKHFGKLVNGIDKRLDTLDVGGNDGLPKPDISGHMSEIDQMGEAQRQIRLLTLKLQQAKLAKEVYDVIYPDNSKEYEARIKELEGHIVSQANEHTKKYSELEMDLGKLSKEFSDYKVNMEQAQVASNEELSKINNELSVVEKKNSELQNERETLVNELKEANEKIDNLTKSLSKYQVLDAETDEVSEGEEENIDELSLPGVDIISGVGGRLIATFNMPDGSKMSGTIGSTLSGDLKITELSVKNVVVKTKMGTAITLPSGAPRIPGSQGKNATLDRNTLSGLMSTLSPEELGQVQNFANPSGVNSNVNMMPNMDPNMVPSEQFAVDSMSAFDDVNPMDEVLNEFNSANGNALNNLLTTN